MEIFGTEQADNLMGTEGNDSIDGGAGNDTIFGGAGDDLVFGGAGNDLIFGGGFEEEFFTVGGRDSLAGGAGDDLYGVSLSAGGGTAIFDEEGDSIVAIFAENTDAEAFSVFANAGNISEEEAAAIILDPNTWGDSFIELSRPSEGIVGLERSGTDLIVDINRDGVAEVENDFTIVNYFDESGNLGSGVPLNVNNIFNHQDVVDLFAGDGNTNNSNAGSGTTVYRFFNNDTGVHFYTANPTERDAVEDLPNFNPEGASYSAVDPLTGGSTPVYRFLNEDTGVHLYTVSEAERQATANLDNFSFEGEAFFAYSSQVEGSIPIYRFFNSTTGAHFYTPSEAERDNVADNLPEFASEGIAYYALPSDF